MKVAVLFLLFVASAYADMYLHNPRGSNNRLDEARRDRNNANRMFDSQNNNRGGYNVGSLYYYEGSILPIEWTNQHSCADQNNHCEIIIQYMCGDLVRDGTTTTTIPNNPLRCEDFRCNTDLTYGMHETFDYYTECRLRQRNMGLFLADQNLNGNSAIYTRQNNQGTRRGYECPEERDYYPYWHPTPWKDVVVMTNQPTRCRYYQPESENVKPRYECRLPYSYINQNRNNKGAIPNNEEDCVSIDLDGDPKTGEWVASTPTGSGPDCIETLWSRDNHLGNNVGGFPNYYNWTIPDDVNENCVLRIRYNISTADYDPWDGSVNSSITARQVNVYDGDTSNTPKRKVSELDVYSKFGFDEETALSRGYVYRQNPVVKVFDDVSDSANNFGLQLAINTNQFGRTFQDRSHTFAIRKRPEELEGETIYNLNVRGKRGNIVQVYPGVEYDFVPNRLLAFVGSNVHIQWTGSNTNPNNNDGQGRAGTDRSNIVLLTESVFAEGSESSGERYGHWGRSYPAHLTKGNQTFLGLDRSDREALAILNTHQFGGEMSELDDAGTYFDLGPRKVTGRGTYVYLCTRNNNFTNRSQKGKITVQANAYTNKRIGLTGGELIVNGHSLRFEEGDLTQPLVFIIEEYSDADAALTAVMENAPEELVDTPPDTKSPFVLISPNEFEGAQGMADLSIEITDSNDVGNTQIYFAGESNRWTFRSLETEIVDGKAVAQIDSGGIYVVAGSSTSLIVIIVVVVVLLVIISLVIVGVVVFFVVRKEKWQSVKDGVGKAKKKVALSFANKV